MKRAKKRENYSSSSSFFTNPSRHWTHCKDHHSSFVDTIIPPPFAYRWSWGVSLFLFIFRTFLSSLIVGKFCLVPPKSHRRQQSNEPFAWPSRYVHHRVDSPLLHKLPSTLLIFPLFASSAPKLTVEPILLLSSCVSHFYLSPSQVTFWYLLSLLGEFVLGLVRPNEYSLDLK